MCVERAFRTTMDELAGGELGSPELLPSRICCAAARALPVDGASMSVHSDHLRVPMGASDPTSALAERLQFTAGAGPCLDALESDAVIDGAARLLEERWPATAALWNEHTPYRSAVAVPIVVPFASRGAINLYLTREDGLDGFEPADLAVVAMLASTALTEQLTDAQLAGVLDTPWARARTRIWIAAGMVMAAFSLDPPQAVSLLRARAIASDVSVDEVVGDLVAGRSDVSTLGP